MWNRSRLLALLSMLCILLLQPLVDATDEHVASNLATSESSNVDEVNRTDSEQENSVESKPESETKQKQSTDANGKRKDEFDATSTDWGTYYDPQNIFCGKYDCYKILGFDYESFGKNHPTRTEITKRYRALSREWHPDKSKHRGAKDRFVKIARAYEVLTNDETRKEYDYMRYNQEAYFQKYGTSVLWSYAPKTDTVMVVLVIFLIANIFSWYSQKHRWQLVADRLVKAAVEDWSPSQGGTSESKELRREALAILASREAENDGEVSSSAPGQGSKKKSTAGKKVSAKDRKKNEQEALLPITKALVEEMDDFGGGFHKPTWRDLLAVHLAKLPFKLAMGIIWQTKYWIRRLQRKELNEEERRVLTQRAVGPVMWDTATDEDRDEWVKRELWVLENLAEWSEEQEVKKLSSAEQKYYNKLKKKGKLE